MLDVLSALAALATVSTFLLEISTGSGSESARGQ